MFGSIVCWRLSHSSPDDILNAICPMSYPEEFMSVSLSLSLCIVCIYLCIFCLVCVCLNVAEVEWNIPALLANTVQSIQNGLKKPIYSDDKEKQ